MEEQTPIDSQTTKSPGLFNVSGVGRSVKIYLPATLIYRGMSFLRGILLAWLLARQTGQYGLLSIALQVINILAPLVSLGLPEAITRYVPTCQQKNNLRSFLRLSAGLTMGITLIATLVLLFFSHPLGRAIFAGKDVDPGQITPLAYSTMVAIFAITAYFIVIAVLKGLRMFGALAVMELVHGTLFLIFSLGAIFFIGPQTQWIVWSYSLAMIIPTLVWGVGIVRQLPAAEKPGDAFGVDSLMRRLAGFGIWAAMGGIVWQSWQLYALWHLTRVSDAINSDIFAAARLIGQLVLIVGAAMSSVVMTHICAIWEKGDREQAGSKYDFYTKLVIFGLIFVGLILIALREPMAMVFPNKLNRISEILPAVLLFYQNCAILGFLAIRFIVIEKMRLLLWPWLAGLIVNVLLSVIMVRPAHALFGEAHAAAWSTWAALIVALVLMYAERQSVSRGLILLIIFSIILVVPILPAGLLFGAIAVWSLWGTMIFDPSQKAIIMDKLMRRR
jgi:O-antigen/teichoic acid export membrane protein